MYRTVALIALFFVSSTEAAYIAPPDGAALVTIGGEGVTSYVSSQLVDINGDGLVDWVSSYWAVANQNENMYLNTGCGWNATQPVTYCPYAATPAAALQRINRAAASQLITVKQKEELLLAWVKSPDLLVRLHLAFPDDVLFVKLAPQLVVEQK